MQQIIQVEIQYIADLLGRIAVPMEIMIYFLGEFIQVGTEQFVLSRRVVSKRESSSGVFLLITPIH